MSPVPEEEGCFSSRFVKELHGPGPWIGAPIPNPGVFFLPKCEPQLGWGVKITFHSWLQKSEKQPFKRLLRNSALQWTASDARVRFLTQCKKLKGKVWANLSWGKKSPKTLSLLQVTGNQALEVQKT